MTAAPWIQTAVDALGIDHEPVGRYLAGQRARRRIAAALSRSTWSAWTGDDDADGALMRAEPSTMADLGVVPSEAMEGIQEHRPERSVGAAPRLAPSMATTDAGVVLLPGARPVRSDWWVDAEQQGERLRTCHEAWLVSEYGARPVTCGQAMCPACAASRAGAYVRHWSPVVDALLAAGCTLAMVTLTRPWQRRSGPVVLGAEDVTRLDAMARARLRKRRIRRRVSVRVDVEPADVGSSSASWTLAEALQALRTPWRTLRNGSASRSWWRETVEGYVTGVEWTTAEVRVNGRECRVVPRWHAHLHALVVLAPGVDLQTWREELVSRWVQLVPDASPEAQDVRTADRESVHEVMKYPFKPADATHAQVLEAWTTSRGLHLHQAGGALHGADERCRLAKAAPTEDEEHRSAHDRTLIAALRSGFLARQTDGLRLAWVRTDRWRLLTVRLLLSLTVQRIELRWAKSREALDAWYGTSVLCSVEEVVYACRAPPHWIGHQAS